ncbi:MAG: response regulator [Opitutus sp.]|nr:response regulator [Opitutus sp.]
MTEYFPGAGWNQAQARALPSGPVHPNIRVATIRTLNPATAKSIILVDDEKSYTDLMSQLLADNLACPVHAFTRPLEALKALPTLDPGVIVTDYFMPQLNGIEFIRQATTVASGASFVMISGHNLSAEENELAKLGALKGFLAKQFGWRKLADEILRVWPAGSTAPTHRADEPSR